MSWISRKMGAVPLWLRLGVPISAVVWLSVGLVVFLNYYNYHKAYHQVSQARYLVLGKDLRQTVEAGLAVGLAPAGNALLEPTLQQAQRKLPDIRFIAVLDETGKPIRELGQRSGDLAAARAGLAGSAEHWAASDAQTYQIGLPFRNSFEQRVGTIVLGYGRTAIDAATRETLLLLLRDAALISLAALALVLFGTWLLTRHLEKGLRAASHAIGQALGKEPIEPESFAVLGPEVGAGIPDFVNASRRAFGQLEALGRKLKSS